MEDVEGVVGELEVLLVVDRGHRGLALGDKVVVVDVLREVADLLELRNGVKRLHQLVEDVVGALDLLLEGDAGLLQEVRLDVATGELAGGVEVDPDEFSLDREKKWQRLS